MNLGQHKVIINTFIFFLFGYFPLVWVFRNRRINDRINNIHKRTLRILYRDHNNTLSKCPVEMGPGGFPGQLFLLQVPPLFQIMPPGSINEKILNPGVIKKLCTWWFLEKLVIPTETEYFHHGHRSWE